VPVNGKDEFEVDLGIEDGDLDEGEDDEDENE
jgi:hypothetical protein